jgi:hypothetical protein
MGRGMTPPTDLRIAIALEAAQNFQLVARDYVSGDNNLRAFQRDAQSLMDALAAMGVVSTRPASHAR